MYDHQKTEEKNIFQFLIDISIGNDSHINENIGQVYLPEPIGLSEENTL